MYVEKHLRATEIAKTSQQDPSEAEAAETSQHDQSSVKITENDERVLSRNICWEPRDINEQQEKNIGNEERKIKTHELRCLSWCFKNCSSCVYLQNRVNHKFSNYRPISILLSFSKKFEKCLYEQIFRIRQKVINLSAIRF